MFVRIRPLVNLCMTARLCWKGSVIIRHCFLKGSVGKAVLERQCFQKGSVSRKDYPLLIVLCAYIRHKQAFVNNISVCVCAGWSERAAVGAC